ncbi:MAG: phosphoenolpyruvate synthase, partial [Gammaproteobacteria bacterium]|nr:phosphoenolpyruvate synthase [Gammaproteobacteria bacterium]
MNKPYVMFFEALGREDVHLVGGKNSSLGEMIQNLSQLGVKVPPGFATTAQAYRDFLSDNGLDKRLKDLLQDLDVENLAQLAEKGAKARQWIIEAPFSSKFIDEMQQAYQTLAQRLGKDFTVAVRSSATAEDLPEASFAGQQETFLNVHGFEEVLQKIKLVFASLYTDRAIAYRSHHGFAHEEVALSAGIQKMVRSDEAAAGVMFTLDTETGSNEIIFITSNYGLGELLVQGSINPDEFYVYKYGLKKGFDAILSRRLGQKQQRMVYNTAGSAERVKIESVPEELRLKFSLTDDEIKQLAQFALTIEAHYGCPMDIEWAKDGAQGELYIVQARPETVKSRQDQQTLERFNLLEQGKVLSVGRSIGQKIGQGRARVIKGLADIDKVQVGDVLVTDMTDPDWEPVMKRAAAIV